MISSKNIADLNASIKNSFINFINDTVKAGYKHTVVSTLRDNEMQDYLYAQGRTRPGNIITNAKAGESYHNYGYAADIIFSKDGKPVTNFTELKALGTKNGLTWGGTFKSIYDSPHWQKTSSDVQKKIEIEKKKINTFLSPFIILGAAIIIYFISKK